MSCCSSVVSLSFSSAKRIYSAALSAASFSSFLPRPKLWQCWVGRVTGFEVRLALSVIHSSQTDSLCVQSLSSSITLQPTWNPTPELSYANKYGSFLSALIHHKCWMGINVGISADKPVIPVNSHRPLYLWIYQTCQLVSCYSITDAT